MKSEAMAMKRGTSLPAGGMVNPFWSQRTREEWQLRAVRPADLPVPEDEETQRQLEQEVEFPALEEGETSRGRTRRSSRVPSPRRAAGVFRTPQSWETGKGVGSVGLRTSGMMPMEEEEMSVNPDRTTPQGVDDRSDPSGQSLQRALEKEVVTQLHEENVRLKQMLSRMQQSKGTGTTSTSEWSEVSGEKEETGRSFMPQTEEKKERIMFTPNGTRVPSQPPPVDWGGQVEMPELPPWPVDLWKDYEKDIGDRKRFKRLGGEPYRPSRELQDLPPEHLGRGMDSRQEPQGSRQVSGRGTNSRQEVRHQEVEGSLGVPQIDRERWLLRELAQLQQALDSEKRSKVRWRVDEDGHFRQVPLGRAGHQGHQEQVPLSRADHPGHQEQVPLSRASHLGYQEGDRAKQWHQGEWGEREVKKELVLEVQDDIKIYQNFLAVIGPRWCWETGWRS